MAILPVNIVCYWFVIPAANIVGFTAYTKSFFKKKKQSILIDVKYVELFYTNDCFSISLKVSAYCDGCGLISLSCSTIELQKNPNGFAVRIFYVLLQVLLGIDGIPP